MVTRKQITTAIDDCEKSFESCWEMLGTIRQIHSKRNFGDSILSFQPTLADALRILDSVYFDIQKDKKYIIGRKNEVNLEWFKRRMKTLSIYQNHVSGCIDIGRAIGDSFAWLFYQDHRDWLSQHQNFHRQKHLPQGLGGRGEVEFIRGAPMIAGHLVIYHGLTTFLRLGDVSLYDIKKRKINGIGEIKTLGMEGKEITMQISFISTNCMKLPKVPGKIKSKTSKLPQVMELRLKRQLNQMQDAMAKAAKPLAPTKLETIHSASHHESLNKIGKSLSASKYAIERAGDGLLLTAIRNTRKSLSSRLMLAAPRTFQSTLKVMPPHATQIICKDSKDNSLTISTFHGSRSDYKHAYGMVPFSWWQVDFNLITDLLFRRVVIVTLYNPAFFVNRLREKGYEVSRKQDVDDFTIKMKIDDQRNGYVEGFAYFTNLVRSHLFTEESVLEIIEKATIESKQHKDKAAEVRINLDIQHFF